MLMNMIQKEKDDGMKEVIATHLFFAIQTKEQQDLAKSWLKEG